MRNVNFKKMEDNKNDLKVFSTLSGAGAAAGYAVAAAAGIAALPAAAIGAAICLGVFGIIAFVKK